MNGCDIWRAEWIQAGQPSAGPILSQGVQAGCVLAPDGSGFVVVAFVALALVVATLGAAMMRWWSE